ncbi:MAG: ATP-binding protein [Oscillospiraceae bacterium]|nr:ATP-binding protein [Oscillospiraceae bacterium]
MQRKPLRIAGPDAKLSRSDKKRLTDAVKKAKRDGRIPASAQQTVPYKIMYRDGLCKVDDTHYTKTIQFQDVNYRLAQPEDQEQIFSAYCDFLNYFDSSISVQLSFINQTGNIEDFRRSISIPDRGDGYDDIRHEYAGMLQDQLEKGNNGLVKRKYITVGVEADSVKKARPRLERIEADIRGSFKRIGAKSSALSGTERLTVLHDAFHPDGNEKFRFVWDGLAKTGLSSKDFIVPRSFDFRETKMFRMGDIWGAASFLQIEAAELKDKLLADLLGMDSAVMVNLHIQTMDQAEAVKTIKRKLTDIEKTKIEEQKKAVRSGYDMDVLPPDLITYGGEAKKMLDDLQSRNERYFLVTVLVVNLAPTRQELALCQQQTAGIAQQNNCKLVSLDFQQEQGLMSSVPLGVNQIEIQRGLTTSSTAIFVPFTTEELFMDGEALYYGINALSSNLIMADRKRLKNPNGLFLGVPGSGKSFSAKREITNVRLLTDDDTIIVDPEGEYSGLTRHLGGQVVHLSPISRDYVNPLDINLNYSDEDDPLALKADFIRSLCELIVGGRDGLEAIEKSMIDKAVLDIYRPYMQNPSPEKMPILQDLMDALRGRHHPAADKVADALELYVTGTLNVFNHRTNVDLHNRLVCFDIKELGKGLKKIAMLILQDQVWNRVTANRAAHKTTWYYCDEFHLLLKDEQTAAYSIEIWKRFRKWGGIPSALTQNVKDLLASREIENIFENSDFIYMLSQAAGDRQILARQLGISETQLSHVTGANPGEGLLFYGNTIIPFVDHFPQNTQLYRIMTTKPEEQEGAANGTEKA